MAAGESAGLMADSELAAAKASYDARGHAVLRGVLDSQQLDAIRQRVRENLVDAGATDGTLTPDRQLEFSADDSLDPRALALSDASSMERLEACFQDAQLVELVSRILNTAEIFSHPTKWMRAVPPMTSELSYPAGVHQDYLELQGSTRQLTMWAPLYPVSEKTGSLPVYEARSAGHVLPMRLADNPSGWEVEPDFLGAKSAYDLLPGDVVVFNTFTPHGGAENRGKGIRVSVEARYQPLCDPISATCLSAPILRDSWDAHYLGWEGLWAGYWKDRHPEKIPFDDTWERWRDVVAVNEGLKGNLLALPALRIASRFAKDLPLRKLASDLYESL